MILRERPQTRVLILSMYADEQYVRSALDAGVAGYILKNALDNDLTRAVRAVAAGQQYLSPELSAIVIRALQGKGESDDPWDQLTEREKQVLQLIAHGKSNKEIAVVLGLSVNTVAVHRANLMSTLKVHKAAELVLYAVKKGLVVTGLIAMRMRSTYRVARCRRRRWTAVRWSRGRPVAAPSALTDVTRRPASTSPTHNGASGKKYLPETMGSGAGVRRRRRRRRSGPLIVVSGVVDRAGVAPATRGCSRTTAAATSPKRPAGLGLATTASVAARRRSRRLRPRLRHGRRRRRLRQRRRARRPAHRGRPEPPVSQHSAAARSSTSRRKAGLGSRRAFSTSAMWFDYDKDGRLDLLICNYVQWTPQSDIFCSADGKTKSYCTPEAYRGSTSWLYRNKGDGTFDDVTAQGRPLRRDLEVARRDAARLRPGRLARRLHRQRHAAEQALSQQPRRHVHRAGAEGRRGVQRGRPRARRHGRRRRRSRRLRAARRSPSPTSRARCSACSAPTPTASTSIARRGSDIGRATRQTLGWGCFFFDVDLDGQQDLLVVNGRLDAARVAHGAPAGVATPTRRTCSSTRAAASPTSRATPATTFAQPKMGRGAAFADIDGDGDLDAVITTNGGPAHLYRTDLPNGEPQPAAAPASARRRTATASARGPRSASARRPRRASCAPDRATCRSRSCR